MEEKEKIDILFYGYIEILEDIKFIAFDDCDTVEEFFEESFTLAEVVATTMETLEKAFGKKELEKITKEHFYFRVTGALGWGNRVLIEYRKNYCGDESSKECS